MEIPKELKSFIPELEDYPNEVMQALYEVAYSLYPDEEHKLLRYYFFGFLLTSDDPTFLASKIEISNTKIEQITGDNGNPYWVMYKRLLGALGLDEDVGNETTVVVYWGGNVKVKVISELEATLYTRRNLIVYKGEYEMAMGAQDLENYKKEIEDRKLKIKIEEIKEPEEGVDNGNKDKGNGKKSAKEGNGSQ